MNSKDIKSFIRKQAGTLNLSILIKSFIGFFLVLIIQVISKSKNYYMAAMAPLFPSIAIFSYYFVRVNKGIESLKLTIIFGILSLLAYFFFLLSLYFFISKFKIVLSLFFSSIIWFIVAFIIIIFWNLYRK